MTRERSVLLVACLLSWVAAGCASTTASAPAATTVTGSGAASATAVTISAGGAAVADSTAAIGSGLGQTPTRQPAPATAAAPETAGLAIAPPAALTSPPTPAQTTARAAPTLPLWSPPADAISLPQPSGSAAVGIAASGFPDTVVFYPAIAGTGRGPHRYVEPAWAAAAGLDPAQMDRVVSSSQIDATPAPAKAPRPVVLLTPGWRSVVALSTSLAEDLASHGYIVLATQTDVVAEWSHSKSTTQDRDKRFAVIGRLLDFLQGPALAAVVGPIDLSRIAVGGHSYAGSIAFDASLTDRRIAVMLDLDGSARGEANRTPPTKPALVLVTVNNGVVADPLLGRLAARSPHIVTAGVLNSLHLDVTDAATIRSLLGTSVFATLVGTVGPAGTTDTSTIVRRFLDVTLGANRRQPSSEELVRDLPSVTADPFG